MLPLAETMTSGAAEMDDVRYVARQPIFDARRALYAYELLFRSDHTQQTCQARDGNQATLSTIDVSLLEGPDSLTDGLPGFVNCTRELLVNRVVTALPRDQAVLEILEDVPPDDEVIQACTALRRAGYRLAVDDFDGDPSRDPLIALAEFIKVDFALTSPRTREYIAQRYRRRGHLLLAEKVETQEEFESSAAMGYEYFQGFFFCKPVTLVAQDIRCLSPAHATLLGSIFDTNFDVDFIERSIRQEPSLCYRLLRYLNSAAFGVYPVRSIRHAITLLGQLELRKWVSIAVAIALAGPRSSILIRTALCRAFFMEALAARLRAPHPNEYFLAGMFSLIDAMLNQRMDVLLTNLPLSTQVKQALTGAQNPVASALQLSLACERADWNAFSGICAGMKLPEPETWNLFEAAQRWARSLQTHMEGR